VIDLVDKQFATTREKNHVMLANRGDATPSPH